MFRRNRGGRCRAAPASRGPTRCCGCRLSCAIPRLSPAGRDLADGFALTGFFLARHVLEPRGLTLSDERAHFIAALARALPSVA